STTAVCYRDNLSCRGNRCSTCGGPGETCCPAGAGVSPTCVSGFICRSVGGSGDAICQHCGGPGEPCCADGGCAGQHCCLGGRCHASGDTCSVSGQSYGLCQSGR